MTIEVVRQWIDALICSEMKVKCGQPDNVMPLSIRRLGWTCMGDRHTVAIDIMFENMKSKPSR